jgi:glycosyltransferase involved in cell wall biosynthesis
MRVALIQSDARPPEEALALARALRDGGHPVTLLVPQPADYVVTFNGYRAGRMWTPSFINQWLAEGFSWVPVGPARVDPEVRHFPRDPLIAAARSLASLIVAFDVAWFLERHWAAPALRERRFRERDLPLIVLDRQPDAEPIPASVADLNRMGAAEYAMRWADLVAPPTADSIDRVAALWQAHAAAPPRVPRPPLRSPAVSVCIPYFENPEYLAQTLESLTRQTSTSFTVIAVDDGSFSAEARNAFDRCSELYTPRGWKFLRQTNQSVGAARNRAASEATTEFVLFLDSDDIAMPDMVERFLHRALMAGCDCLVAPHYTFDREPDGPCLHLYEPPGHSLIASMCDDMYGGGCMLVRREVFLRFAGFSTLRGVGYEDYELHVRMNLEQPPNAVSWETLPDYVYRYREPQAGNLSRSSNQYTNLGIVLRWYRRRLQPAGLGQLPLALGATYQKMERLRFASWPLNQARAQRVPQRPHCGPLRLLLLACYLPYGYVSGWQTRVNRMIRYFGSRYQVTLATCMPREHIALNKDVFRHLHALRGIGGDTQCGAHPSRLPALPERIRFFYTQTFRDAMRALPTDSYHVALLDQIFMAEFRNDIDTTCVITEHNIESRLLRQAAQRQWDRALPKEFHNPLQQADLMERYEDSAWSDVPLRSVCSEVDAAQMDSRARRGSTVIVPNGADLESWQPGIRFSSQTILFPGHLEYLPNVDAIEFLLNDIWPRIRKRKPKVRLILAGAEPAPAVRAMAASAPGVELRANPRSMPHIARRASVMVAPLRLGSGTRTKIIEAMAWGLPLVSTTLGAEGIDVVDQEHLLLADTAEAIAERLLQLLTDQPLWDRLRASGRELVRQRYSWEKVFKPLEDGIVKLLL